MTKANIDIRKAAEESGIRQWQLADRLGIPESRFCVMLRKELPEDTKKHIFAVIEEMKEYEVI